jgi:hypothetical protein
MRPVDRDDALTAIIEKVRGRLVCDRCGRYVGSLSPERYLRPPYPIAVDTYDDNVTPIVAFERYMADRLAEGRFTIRHAQLDGRCVSYRDWLRAEYGEDDEEEDPD